MANEMRDPASQFPPLRSRRDWLLAVLALAGANGCRRSGLRPGALRIWAHHGRASEHDALMRIRQAFSKASGRQADLSFFPDFQYTEKLAVAAAAGDLPDVFELDGPLVATFAAAELLAPLDDFFSAREIADFLPTIVQQGTLANRLYALGAFDSIAVLYFDQDLMNRAGVDEAASGEGFAWDELVGACERLRRLTTRPLALHMNEAADEWFSYAFSPVLWSVGGALIGSDGRSIRGVLSSERNRDALQRWQQLFSRGIASATPVEPDPFGAGQVAMDWSGHWMLRSHLRHKGERLGIMPLPRSGPGARRRVGRGAGRSAPEARRAERPSIGCAGSRP